MIKFLTYQYGKFSMILSYLKEQAEEHYIKKDNFYNKERSIVEYIYLYLICIKKLWQDNKKLVIVLTCLGEEVKTL